MEFAVLKDINFGGVLILDLLGMIGWDLAVGIFNTCAMSYKCVYACMLYIFNRIGSVQVSYEKFVKNRFAK